MGCSVVHSHPAHHTSSTMGAPNGCLAPSLGQARQGRKQGPPSQRGLLLGTASWDRPQPFAHPPAESQRDFAQEAEGWFSMVLSQTGISMGAGLYAKWPSQLAPAMQGLMCALSLCSSPTAVFP